MCRVKSAELTVIGPPLGAFNGANAAIKIQIHLNIGGDMVGAVTRGEDSDVLEQLAAAFAHRALQDV